MEQLIGHVVRDFVNNWYTNINHSRSPAFPDAVHATLRHAFLKFGASAKHTRPTALVLPVFQAMILHMVSAVILSSLAKIATFITELLFNSVNIAHLS